MSGIYPADLGNPIADAQRNVDRQDEREREQVEADLAVAIATAEMQAAAVQRELAENLDLILGDTLKAEMANAYADSTRKVYRGDIQRFKKWCIEAGLAFLPAAPATIASFLLEMAGTDIPPRRAIIRMRTAIGYLHQVGQFPNPCDDVLVRATMRWIRERHAEAESEPMKGKTNGQGHH